MVSVTALASSIAGMRHLQQLELRMGDVCTGDEGRAALKEAAATCFGPDWGSQAAVETSFVY